MSINKVIYGDSTLIDLTSDSVTASALMSGVTAHDSSGALVTGTIAAKTSADIMVAGPTISVPSGAYSAAVSTTIPEAVLETRFDLNLDILNYSLNSATGKISVSGAVGLQTHAVHNPAGSGYADYDNSVIRISTTVASSYQLPTQSAATITPTESVQTAAESGKFLTGNITVAAISSDYIGSNITQRSSTDLAASGSYINVPAGYYASAASKAIAYGSYKSNDSISVTPGIAINSNNGLIQSSVNVTSNRTPVDSYGYFDNTFGLKTVVAGSSSKQLDIQAATTINPTESEQTAVAKGKYTTGIVKVGAISSNYVGSNIATRSAATYTPTTTAQVISAGQYLTGAQTISGDTNLIAANIASGVTIFGVVGTHSGGVTPTGTISITSNGTYDVTNYASASVNIGAVVSGSRLIVPEGMIGV